MYTKHDTMYTNGAGVMEQRNPANTLENDLNTHVHPYLCLYTTADFL